RERIAGSSHAMIQSAPPRAARPGSMPEKNYLCALDLPDSLPLGPHSIVRICGWVIPTGDAAPGTVTLRVNGATVSAAYPTPRPDVKSYYPQFANAELSGFVTARVPLEFG